MSIFWRYTQAMNTPTQNPKNLWTLERTVFELGHSSIAGIDEAGRGAWAGPLTVAAVILPLEGMHTNTPLPFRDSKTLSATRREHLALEVKALALAWAVEFAEPLEIEHLGVLGATHAAALRAIARLQPAATALITDYLKLKTALPLLAPAKADQNSYSVAAASVLAKTARDAHMLELEQLYPGYGFAQHKGYGTAQHQMALEGLGCCAAHRRSFAPIKALLERGERRLF